MNRNKWKVGSAALILGLLLYAAHPLYLAGIGHFFIVSDAPTKADVILVLAGGNARDERLLHAIKLWHEGYAPQIALSAVLADWQNDEDFPAWRHAMKLNILPKESLFVLGHKADSTREEAEVLLPLVQNYGFKRVIIVTSNYHTRRSKKVFQKQWAGSGIHVDVSAAPDDHFHPDDWWKHRGDSRTLFLEATKTFWYALFE
ncbi:MAG: YdcF family protein [Nitrospirae bacterium]|nr:YdcF family protein [Candidatus Manganitrophaceae bacterium]